MNPQYWQPVAATIGAIAALLAGLYGIVTVPLLRTLKAEVSASEARLKAQMTEMESRLSQRIADKLNDHGERIRSLEERRFR